MNFKQMKVFYILANILGVLLVHLSYINNIKFQFIIAVLALTIMVTEFLAYKKRTAQYRLKYFALSLLFLFVAQVFSQLDIHRIWCEPTNHIILQGHALWHLFAGIGCFLASKHFEEVVLTKSAHNLSQSLS